jgi:uncharacterized protein YjbI with pentapeptide repeats
MADKQHLALLGELEKWNKWRRTCVDRPDLYEANLGGWSLDEALLHETNLRKAILNAALLRRADMRASDIQEANLDNTEAEGARFQLADLSSVEMNDAKLAHAKMNNTILAGAKVRKSDFTNASMRSADCRGVDFRGATLTGADLLEANLSAADLRGAKGFFPNSTYIRGAQFSPRARDWWSVLRRSYTGPKLVFNLLFLTAFLLPYLGKGLFWSSVNRGQATLGTTVMDARSRAQDPEAGYLLEQVTPCISSDCTEWPIWQVLIGVDRGPEYWVLSSLLVLFNVLRGVMTWIVGPIRDEEERSGYSPAASYAKLIWMHHFVTGLGVVAVIAFVYHMSEWLRLTIWLPT